MHTRYESYEFSEANQNNGLLLLLALAIQEMKKSSRKCIALQNSVALRSTRGSAIIKLLFFIYYLQPIYVITLPNRQSPPLNTGAAIKGMGLSTSHCHLARAILLALIGIVAAGPGVDVFTAGEAGYFCIKIPSLLATPSGALLATGEGRHDNCSDYTWTDLVFKRSTDGGKTWCVLFHVSYVRVR